MDVIVVISEEKFTNIWLLEGQFARAVTKTKLLLALVLRLAPVPITFELIGCDWRVVAHLLTEKAKILVSKLIGFSQNWIEWFF